VGPAGDSQATFIEANAGQQPSQDPGGRDWMHGRARRVMRVVLEGGREIRAYEAGSELSEVSNAVSERQREVAFSLFPDHDSGELEQQIDDFYASEGLTTAPALILKPKEIPRLIKGLRKAGYRDMRLNKLGRMDNSSESVVGAIYLGSLGLIVACRPEEFQQSWERTFLQFLLAHEKSHSTSTFSDEVYMSTKKGPQFYSGRIGLGVIRNSETGKSIGELLEEAVPTYMAARYIRNGLNKPNGVWGEHESFRIREDLTLPSVHVWPTESGQARSVFVQVGSPLAYGFERLVGQHPELHGALIESRKSVEGLREVAKILNKIQPGLYRQLRDLPETFASSIDGLKLIQQIETTRNKS
jgi:hypothetical protein